MRMLTLILISAISLASSTAFAASYQRTDGTIVDPIQSLLGGNHAYSSFSGINLEPGAYLQYAYLRYANLTNANLTNAWLFQANLYSADLTDANLTSATLINADLFLADLTGATLINAHLINADLFLADLFGANLTNANLDSADLTGATLINADLTNSSLFQADLNNANLTGAILANAGGLGTTFGSALYNINTDFTNAWTGFAGSSELFDPVAAGWTLVPEPNSAILIGIGLIGMSARKRTTSKTL